MTEIIAIAVASLFFMIGLIGTLLPVLPGPLVIWFGMLVYSFILGFEELGIYFFIFQGLLALAVMGVDYLFSAMGSRYFGGSKAAFYGAAGGLLIGLFFFPFGLLLGPFLGATLAELLSKRKSSESLKSGVGALIGFLGALPVKLVIEAVMIIWFITSIY